MTSDPVTGTPVALAEFAQSFLGRSRSSWMLMFCALVMAATSLVSAQAPFDSPLDNPFPDQNPAYLQPQEMPGGLPPQPQYPPSLGPAVMPTPAALPRQLTFGEMIFADERQTPQDYRAGAFQKFSFLNTYMPRMGSNGFGLYSAELTTVWGLPCPTKDSPLVVTPGFATHWLDGPDDLDVPSQLHDVYAQFRWLPKIGQRFRADVAVQPSYSSDWNGSSTRSVRITGHGSGIFDWTPTFQLVLGVAYLDRPDIELLPIAGFIWKPDPGAEYRLVFPAPKISWLLSRYVPQLPYTFDTWFYVAGELGGGTWAIRHSDGVSDLMSYSDWRIFTGLETRSLGLGSQIEIGYSFQRRIRLTSIGDDWYVGDTVLVRAALNY